VQVERAEVDDAAVRRGNVGEGPHGLDSAHRDRTLQLDVLLRGAACGADFRMRGFPARPPEATGRPAGIDRIA
jgi:hypothetical protein